MSGLPRYGRTVAVCPSAATLTSCGSRNDMPVTLALDYRRGYATSRPWTGDATIMAGVQNSHTVTSPAGAQERTRLDVNEGRMACNEERF